MKQIINGEKLINMLLVIKILKVINISHYAQTINRGDFMIDYNSVDLSNYYCTNKDLKDYYLSLPKPIRDRLDESGVQISTLGELKQTVEYMKQF